MEEAKEFSNCFATNRKVKNLRALPVREKYLHIAKEALQIGSTSERKDFMEDPFHFFDEEELEKQRKSLKKLGWEGERLIAIIPGTSWETKKWHFLRWKELIAKIQRNKLGIPLIFWGNQEEFSVARALAESNAILWQGGGLKALMASLYLASVAVGPDTGPIHMASLIGVPTVSIYRATSSFRNKPPLEKDLAIQAELTCSPCLRRVCPSNEICSFSISVDTVFTKITELLLSP